MQPGPRSVNKIFNMLYKAAMKLISWNVNGLRSICAKGFLDFVLQHQPDILCLQEIKIQDDQLNPEAMIPPGYEAFFSMAEKSGYSGLATYIRSNGKKSSVKPIRGIGIKKMDSEGRFLITQHQGMLLYNVYIPSGTMGEARQKFKYQFLDAFSEHLSSLSQSDFSKLVICGDFNICHREIDIHHPQQAEKRQLTGFLPEERAWLDSFLELGLIDTFRFKNGEVKGQYSWWSFRAGARKKNLGWRLDYFFCAKALAKKIKSAKILSQVAGSDHCPVLLELSL